MYWCDFELHTKGEYEKSFKSDTLASFGWIILAVTVLLGTVVAIENSGILSNDLFSEPNTTKEERKMNTEQIAFDIHYEVNEVRKLHGLKPLPWSSTIAEIAKKHSQDMSERNYLSHISPDEKDVVDRYEQANFVCVRKLPNGDILKGAENLAEISYPDDLTGIGTRVVQSWMNSPSHRENLLFKEYGKEGIGVVISDSVLYITQNFC